jgi:hypothetical protein
LEAVVVEVGLTARFVCDHDYIYWPVCGTEA